MASGLSFPVRASKSGGAAVDEESRQLQKILELAFSPGEDDNPFQALGISESVLFQVNDPSARGVLRSQVRKILSKFSDRVALDQSRQISIQQNEEGKLVLAFRYVNLETNQVTDFQTTLGG